MGNYFNKIGTATTLYLLLNSANAQDKSDLARQAREYTPADAVKSLFGSGVHIGKYKVAVKVPGLQEGIDQIKEYIESFEDWAKKNNRTVEKRDYTKRHRKDPSRAPMPEFRGSIDDVVDEGLLMRLNDGDYSKRVARINRMNDIIPIQYSVWQQESTEDVITFDYVVALTRGESDFFKAITSHADAKGLMQIIRPTWRLFNKKSYDRYVFDPEENTRTGIRCAENLMEYYRDNIVGFEKFSERYQLKLVTAGYNWRPDQVVKAINSGRGIDSMPKETREHIQYVDWLLFGG